MVKRAERPDFRFEQLIREALEIVQALGIRFAGAVGLDARPGNGKAIAFQIHLLQQRHVFLVAMIGVASDVAGVSTLYFADGVRETVPDRFSLAIFVPASLNLI